MRLLEGGFIQHWTKKLMTDHHCDTSMTNVAARTFTMRDMAGCFIILFVGITISTVVLITEGVVHRVRHGPVNSCFGVRCWTHQGNKGANAQGHDGEYLAGDGNVVWQKSWVEWMRWDEVLGVVVEIKCWVGGWDEMLDEMKCWVRWKRLSVGWVDEMKCWIDGWDEVLDGWMRWSVGWGGWDEVLGGWMRWSVGWVDEMKYWVRWMRWDEMLGGWMKWSVGGWMRWSVGRWMRWCVGWGGWYEVLG